MANEKLVVRVIKNSDQGIWYWETHLDSESMAYVGCANRFETREAAVKSFRNFARRALKKGSWRWSK